ncbi:MAG: SEC-C domain-containing protein [Chloroflexota bacterium]
MPKVGRNDLCYCGSGKKYKHCHWESDQAATRSRLNTRRARQSLFARLVDFAQRPRFEGDYRAAFELFWDGRRKATDKNALTQPEAIRFYEWYLVDYRSSHDRARLIDLFRAQGAGYITPEERAYLGAWQSAQFGICAVRESLPDGAAKMYDVLRETEHVVRDPNYTAAMKPGEWHMARLATLAEDTEFILSVTQLAAEQTDNWLAFAREQFSRYADAHFGATMGEFLRESSYRFNHQLLNLSGDAAQSGGQVVLPTRAELQKTAATLSVTAAPA